MQSAYRGRLAPSPTGLLHLGHAATFLVAAQRAAHQDGILIYRNDNLDSDRCRPEFTEAALYDLNWIGIHWTEEFYIQSARLDLYREAFFSLLSRGWLYPCSCSRRDVASALRAPHPVDEEPIYPGHCRTKVQNALLPPNLHLNWRFRIPNPELLSFEDGCQGLQKAVAGEMFGDFLVWRKDGFPSYQLASAVDDMLLNITEIVRGADLITSTFRQLLLWRALDHTPPAFYHCPLLADNSGQRLAKRNNALSIRSLREKGLSPADVRALAASAPTTKSP
ncbi:MAG: glutamate--tRNA ligase family protein [Verrucomicrobiota bacterium]